MQFIANSKVKASSGPISLDLDLYTVDIETKTNKEGLIRLMGLESLPPLEARRLLLAFRKDFDMMMEMMRINLATDQRLQNPQVSQVVLKDTEEAQGMSSSLMAGKPCLIYPGFLTFLRNETALDCVKYLARFRLIAFAVRSTEYQECPQWPGIQVPLHNSRMQHH